MIEGVIYRYKSPSGKYYIGQTINEEIRRKHFLYSNNYGGQKIDNARNKYGPKNFEYTVLMKVTGDNPDEVKNYLDTLEIGFIRMYDSIENGYNTVKGGEGCIGFSHSEQTKEKISAANKGHPSWNKGKTLSDEHKRKLSESHKNPSVETRNKMSASHKGQMTGKHHTLETKRKISESHKGKSSGVKGRHRVYNPDGTWRMVK
jgi:group I intron endonuclease